MQNLDDRIMNRKSFYERNSTLAGSLGTSVAGSTSGAVLSLLHTWAKAAVQVEDNQGNQILKQQLRRYDSTHSEIAMSFAGQH